MAQPALQVVGKCGYGLIAFGRALLQGAPEDEIQVAEADRLRRALGEQGLERLGGAVTAFRSGMATGEQNVEQDAERVDVGGGGNGLTAHLLGRGVLRRA